jgi:SAM-dependent methyltransferase
MDKARDIGAQWDERYRSASRVFRAEPDETLVELVSPLGPGRAVDVGAGEGRNSLWLASAGWKVTAVDLSGVGLGRIAEGAVAEGLEIETVLADGTAYLEEAAARGEGFDLAVLAFVHPAPGERTALLHAAAAALAPGGHLLLVGHHRISLGIAGPPDPDLLYTEGELAAEVTGLDILRLEQRHGPSDVEQRAVDLVLWAVKP